MRNPHTPRPEFMPLDFVPSPSALYGESHDESVFDHSATNRDTSTSRPTDDTPIVQSLLSELRTLAALESSIYLARSQSRAPAVALHTPARRLARTVVTFGVDDGIAFGLRALRAIEAIVDGCRDDVRGLCFWWSNCVQLRWMLWAMCGGAEATDPDMGDFAIVMQNLVPPLRQLESHVLEDAVEHLWQRVTLPIARQAAGAADVEDGAPYATGRWLAALTQARLQLMPVQVDGDGAHERLLARTMIPQLLDRMDVLLFDALQGGVDVDATLLLWGDQTLTFADGMAIRMALTRWKHWARDCGVADGDLFPHMVAASNLLMLPKEQVMDHSVRAEIAPGLSAHHVHSVLSRFRPDDLAPDPIPKGVLERLRRECAAVPEGPNALQPTKYVPVAETVLLSERLIEPVSLEMDAESDEELEGLGARCGGDVCRFSLLRDVWAASSTV